MLYVLVSGAMLLLLIVAIMVKLWRSYYGEKHVALMLDVERERVESRLKEMGAEEGIRVRKLFEGEVLWAEGTQDTWRWSWEAGKRGTQVYMRFLVTFVGGLGQGLVIERGGRERGSEEAPGALGPRVVMVEEGILPAHFLCKARDEARLHAFLSMPRSKRIRVLDDRLSAFYFDDRRLFVQRQGVTGADEIDALLELTHGFVEDVLRWAASQGVISALETGQYQGALAELEQSTVRDTSVLEQADGLEPMAPEELSVSGARDAQSRDTLGNTPN